MAYNFQEYVHNIKTKDDKEIGLTIHSNLGVDDVLLDNIKNEIRTSMDTTVSIKNLSAEYHQVKLLDGKGKPREFAVCFILTWENRYTQVKDVNLISCVEM